MDPRYNSFDRDLRHIYQEWEPIVPGFRYHGRNTYAYLLSRYGSYVNINSQKTEKTFDLVTIQLYEGYSHAEYNTTIMGVADSYYLVQFVDQVLRGWQVDFSTDPDLQYPVNDTIRIAPSQLVIGLANGWAGDGKFLLIYPAEVGYVLSSSLSIYSLLVIADLLFVLTLLIY